MVERRDLLRKAAAAGMGAFALPMIVTVDPADAQALTSPPPESPGRASPPEIGPTDSTASGAPAANRTAARHQASGRSELPRTGADIDRLVAAGLAATAGGAALVLWSADARSRAVIPSTVPDTFAESPCPDPES
jgi:hypothetical protein